jgi:carbamoyltransferase
MTGWVLVMNILGIIHHEDFGHPAACLLQEGKLVAMAEEERFVRVKQAKGYFPGESIRYCLQTADIGLKEVDYIAFGWDAHKYPLRYTSFLGRSFLQHRLFRKSTKVRDPQLKARPSLGTALFSGLKDILATHPKNLRQNVVFGLREAGFTDDSIPPIVYVGHHLAHAATAFYCSGLEESAILVYDGHGEENTVTIWQGRGLEIKPLHQINIPHSLGWFYSLFTEFLGWSPNEGEVKLMGLAPYGNPDPRLQKLVEEVLQLHPEGIRLNPDYMFFNDRSYGRFYSDLLVEKLGPPRGKFEAITDFHQNLAFAVQNRLEEAGLHLAQLAMQKAGSRNLCLAGGVALNCKLNGRIHQAGLADHFFVQPLSYDAGVALGAAMVLSQAKGQDCRFEMEHLYWGPEFSDEQIETVLQRSKVSYQKIADPARRTAQMIAEGQIVGWFQGRLEAGPRALGGRSILADPRYQESADRVNEFVKFRESWRPFALSMLEEASERFLPKAVSSPFMIMAFPTYAEQRDQLAGGMHSGDFTTRPQTVRAQTNPLYHQMITAFAELTGVPAVLNTSFNIKGEPIVCKPEDALRCFYATGMDALVMGSFLVQKR